MPIDVQRAVAAAIVVQDRHVLLVRRRIAEGALSWQFPAGKIEADETSEEAAVRETREETGLLVAPIRALGQRIHPMTGQEIHYIACRALGGEAFVASVEELAELAWVSALWQTGSRSKLAVRVIIRTEMPVRSWA
ncbi:NUDIX hydrolase [Streptomyces sp. NPDC087894]|uniref:NUDIX hydrolase n=1 Tax=Streptomyces sp. NPDC087894 TaxID=3365816 RepID=UPI0038054625